MYRIEEWEIRDSNSRLVTLGPGDGLKLICGGVRLTRESDSEDIWLLPGDEWSAASRTSVWISAEPEASLQRLAKISTSGPPRWLVPFFGLLSACSTIAGLSSLVLARYQRIARFRLFDCLAAKLVPHSVLTSKVRVDSGSEPAAMTPTSNGWSTARLFILIKAHAVVASQIRINVAGLPVVAVRQCAALVNTCRYGAHGFRSASSAATLEVPILAFSVRDAVARDEDCDA